MTVYLTQATILAIHRRQIELYGGAEGLRDERLLDAAIHRPQTGYYQDVVEKAAALWESLSQNHPFIDGNKRVAVSAMIVFLGVNGLRISADADAVYSFLDERYSTGTMRFDILVPWLRANTEPL